MILSSPCTCPHGCSPSAAPPKQNKQTNKHPDEPWAFLAEVVAIAASSGGSQGFPASLASSFLRQGPLYRLQKTVKLVCHGQEENSTQRPECKWPCSPTPVGNPCNLTADVRRSAAPHWQRYTLLVSGHSRKTSLDVDALCKQGLLVLVVPESSFG